MALNTTMKNLLFTLLLFAFGANIEAPAQTITIDSLNRYEITLVRQRLQSMFTDSAAFESDTLLLVVRGINQKIRQQANKNLYSITVPYAVARKYAQSFATAIPTIDGEEKRARETLRLIQFQKKILRSAYQAEKQANVPDDQSMFANWLLYSENRKVFFKLITPPQKP
jgi:hypothetical protein